MSVLLSPTQQRRFILLDRPIGSDVLLLALGLVLALGVIELLDQAP
jgi:hypothetical protein